MKDLRNKEIAVGDTVAVLHKKRPTTTATLQIGTVIWVSAKMCDVEVKGLKTTRHTSKTIVKL